MRRQGFLSPADLALRWKVSQATLAAWRKAGKGPPFTQLGGPRCSVRYSLPDVLAYEADRYRTAGRP